MTIDKKLTVWKFPMRIADVAVAEMPKGARLLRAGIQNDTFCVWALVDPEAPKVERRVRIAGTGHPIAADLTEVYVNTFEMHGGALVFHVFDLGELRF